MELTNRTNWKWNNKNYNFTSKLKLCNSYNQGSILILRKHISSSLESIRPVDEIQVQILKPKSVQRLFECHLNVIGMVEAIPHLAGHEDVAPCNVELTNGLFDALKNQ